MFSKKVLVMVLAGILLFGTAAYAWQLTLNDSRGNQYDLNYWSNAGGNALLKGKATNWGYGTPVVRDCITSIRRYGYGIAPSVNIMVMGNDTHPSYSLVGRWNRGFTYAGDEGSVAQGVNLHQGPLPK